MSNEIYYTSHDGGATLFMDGKLKSISSDHPNFMKIMSALKAKSYDLAIKLMDMVGTINDIGSNVSKKFVGRRVFVEGETVYFTDENGKHHVLHGTLVDRIIDDIGKPSGQKYADALLALQDNIMRNTRKDIREELYEFLMSGKTPITMDGCFLAYKKVKAANKQGQYLDIYSGTMDNAPGKIPRMDPKDVDADRYRECSRGLHFCSRGYLSHYGNGDGDDSSVVMVVKVNPKDVFAIPTDYSFQKGRASEYYVVGMVNKGHDLSKSDVFKDSFIDEDSKEASAPNVTFKAPLKAGLQTVGESYGLINDGKCLVIEQNGKYVPVRSASFTGKVDAPGADQVKHRLGKVIMEMFELASFEVTSDLTLEQVGGDSLDAVELVMAIEDEFEIEISDDDAEKFHTSMDILNYLLKVNKIFPPNKYSYVDVLGTPVTGEPKLMSFETKSVRQSVKEAVQKAQGSVKS